MTVTSSGLKSCKVLWQMKTNCESQEWSSYRMKKPPAVFCNSTECNKSIANKKYLKNERVFLRGDWHIMGNLSQRQGLSHLSVGRECEVCVELIFGIPLKITWELEQRMPGVAAVCTAGLCALIHNSCPACDWSNEHISGLNKGVCHERAPQKEGDCSYVIVILTGFVF